MLIDLLFLAVLVWVAFRVAAEGAWGAVVIGFSVLFAGLLAMNVFEPLAEWLEIHVSADRDWRSRWDVISLVGVFTGAVLALRVITERLAPATMPIPQPADILLRWLAGAATGYLVVAFLLTAVHVAPLPRLVTGEEVIEVAGFQAEREKLFGLAPDLQWLAFNQRLSQEALNRGDADRLFDGPIFESGGEVGRWPSFPIRYAARREALTRARMGLPDLHE